jgi:hypothetical protein
MFLLFIYLLIFYFADKPKLELSIEFLSAPNHIGKARRRLKPYIVKYNLARICARCIKNAVQNNKARNRRVAAE